jgi:hypothetical protein
MKMETYLIDSEEIPESIEAESLEEAIKIARSYLGVIPLNSI